MAASVLRGKGYAPFAPLYKSRKQWSDRIKVVETPLFPGYLFCRLDLQNRLPVLITPGVTQIVGYGRVPAEVDEAEIASLQTMIASGLPSRPWPFLQAGDLVEIEQGPLRGLRGILLEMRGTNRMVLSISLLKRSVAVEIDPVIVKSLSNAQTSKQDQDNRHATLPTGLKKDVGTLGQVFSPTGPPAASDR